MTIERYQNNATTTLNGAINASVTTVTVADATQLPTLTGSDQFRIRVESEEMIVTGVSGNDLTVTRGAEGTTAAIHGNGATVTHNLTAASLLNVPISESNLTLSDVTTDNVSTTKHGFAPKAPNDATKYLDGTGAYSTPAGSGMSNPMTTQDDLIVGGSSGTPARLARGSDSQVLTVDPSTHHLAWATPAGSGAPTSANYVTTAADATLSAEIVRPQFGNYFADTPNVSPDSMDDEFDDTSGNSGSGNGLDARWSWLNQSTSTFTFGTQGWGKLNVPAHSGHQVRGLVQTLPGDGTYDLKMALDYPAADTVTYGILLRDGVNADSYQFSVLLNNLAPAAISLRVDSSATDTTGFANLKTLTAANNVVGLQSLYLRFVKSGTAFSFFWSTTGIGWVFFHSLTDAVGPTQIGFFIDAQSNTSSPSLYVDWFRKTA